MVTICKAREYDFLDFRNEKFNTDFVDFNRKVFGILEYLAKEKLKFTFGRDPEKEVSYLIVYDKKKNVRLTSCERP